MQIGAPAQTQCFLLVSFFKKGKIAKHPCAVKVIQPQ